MKTTTATLRTFRVARLIPNGLRHTAIVTAESPAAAVREALGLDKTPRMDHSGPNGSGFRVTGDRGFVAHYAAEEVPECACPVCGETHATELGDHADERTGGWASARTAQATAHFRLSIAATSAGPFRLHGGRAA
mgnify:FL=1